MISEKHSFLFIHCAKTAGNSISNTLLEFCEDEKELRFAHQDGVQRFNVVSKRYGTNKHFTLQQYRDSIPCEVFDALFKFSVIRNPYDRMVSAYFSPNRWVDRGPPVFDREEFISVIRKQRTLRSVVCLDEDDELLSRVDTLLVYENLQEDFKSLLLRLGLPHRDLDHVNKSSRTRDLNEYYDNGTRSLVQEIFGEEIDRGGYTAP